MVVNVQYFFIILAPGHPFITFIPWAVVASVSLLINSSLPSSELWEWNKNKLDLFSCSCEFLTSEVQLTENGSMSNRSCQNNSIYGIVSIETLFSLRQLCHRVEKQYKV